MSTPHHHGEPASDEQRRLVKRFMEEAGGTAEREYPQGRIGPDDDGATTYAVAADRKRGIIRIQFPKPTLWLGLDIAAAEQLREVLTQKLIELRVGKA